MNRDLSAKVVWGILIPFFILIGLGLQNKTALQDWMYFRSYQPSAQIALIAETADLSMRGEKLFFRADPELIGSNKISQSCLGADNLGCLVTGPKIYILDYQEQQTERFNQATVTAAHEMLHMSYFRLSEDEKASMKLLLDQALAKISNNRIFNILNKSRDDYEYYDESYALLGTEVRKLPLELEAHYRELFNSRDSILEAFDKSKSLL